MKAVPILVVTNVLALALVAVLWVGQSDLKDQLSTRRTPAERNDEPAYDDTTVNERIARLEARFARSGGADTPEAGGMAVVEGGSDAPADADADSAALATLDADADADAAGEVVVAKSPGMEAFRKKVAEAIELNREEDRINRMVSSIDELTSGNKIAALSPKQKVQVARSLLSARDRIPQIWRNMRNNPDVANMSGEERRAAFRSEYDSLKAQAQKELEAIVPAADAKTIVDHSVSMRGSGRDRGRRRGR